MTAEKSCLGVRVGTVEPRHPCPIRQWCARYHDQSDPVLYPVRVDEVCRYFEEVPGVDFGEDEK